MTVDLLVPLAALGLGVALSPVAVIASILLVVAPGGRRKGAAFVAGWVGGLATVGAVVVVLEQAVGVGRADGPGWFGAVVTVELRAPLVALGLVWKGVRSLV